VSTLAQPALPLNETIMIVDDSPANLTLLEGLLAGHGYEVRSFSRGRQAIAAASKEPPHLILLDINMPEMNGYQVCEELKASERTSGIPVIFLSALNATEDKVQGFRSGGVDYISKPFQFEEVEARVKTHLQLRRAQQAEHDLLDRTLSGAVGTLWELVHLTSPMLASRSHAVRDIVRWIAQRLAIADAWQYDLAATLCLVGCITLPDDVFERAYRGLVLSPAESQMFRAHPETAARLLAKIPRLETVAEMIRRQQNPGAQASTLEPADEGAHLLHLALEFDRRIYRGDSRSAACAELRQSRRFENRMLEAVEAYAPDAAEYDARQLPIRYLRAGMLLGDDVRSRDGNLLILKGGTILTEIWIERLQNFANTRGAKEPIDVRIPRIDSAGT